VRFLIGEVSLQAFGPRACAYRDDRTILRAVCVLTFEYSATPVLLMGYASSAACQEPLISFFFGS